MKGLEGIKLIELTGYIASPATCRLLADFGCEVIKIEPFHGDDGRHQGPTFGMVQNEWENPGFDMANMNKNYISLNLKHPEGMKFIHKMIADADILITNFRDTALKKLGLDYETLHRLYPGLIYGHMRGYGERGPLKDERGFDAVAYAARGGIMATFCQQGESPAIPAQAFGDYQASVCLAAGVLAALVNKQRTGVGDKAVVNLYHVANYMMSIAMWSFQDGAEYPKSRKNVPQPFNNLYQTSDGIWMLLCHPNYDKYHNEVFEVLGLHDLVNNPLYDFFKVLKEENRIPKVIKLMDEKFKLNPYEYWDKVLTEHETPHQKCFGIQDILDDEEAWANDQLRRIEYETLPGKAAPTTPVRLQSLGDPEMKISKPIGYHTVKYMKKYGYSEENIINLEKSGAVLCYRGENNTSY